eukprot:SAG31_NODE_20244_length_580_cov_0.958420_1_plen_22_part_10
MERLGLANLAIWVNMLWTAMLS